MYRFHSLRCHDTRLGDKNQLQEFVPILLVQVGALRCHFVEKLRRGAPCPHQPLHDRINPKDCQVLSLGDSGFLQFFRVVSSDYGKPRDKKEFHLWHEAFFLAKRGFLGFLGIFLGWQVLGRCVKNAERDWGDVIEARKST